jgi:WXG100 family type VII secretion target
MNYNLIVEPDNLRQLALDVTETNEELKKELEDLRVIEDEIPGCWTGKDSINFFTNFDAFVTSLYDITYFYEELSKNIEQLGREYDSKDYEFYRRNMMG